MNALTGQPVVDHVGVGAVIKTGYPRRHESNNKRQREKQLKKQSEKREFFFATPFWSFRLFVHGVP
jgi:hypothetical protein